MVRQVNDLRWLRKNERVKRLLEQVKSGVFSIDGKSLMDEIERLHSNKKVRSLTFKSFSTGGVQKRLIDANSQNQSYRSRITEIKMTVFRKRRALEKRLDSVSKELKTTYSQELRKVYKTQQSVKDAMTSVLDPAFQKIYELEGFEKFADMAIADCEAGYWSLKLSLDAFALSLKDRNL